MLAKKLVNLDSSNQYIFYNSMAINLHTKLCRNVYRDMFMTITFNYAAYSINYAAYFIRYGSYHDYGNYVGGSVDFRCS